MPKEATDQLASTVQQEIDYYQQLLAISKKQSVMLDSADVAEDDILNALAQSFEGRNQLKQNIEDIQKNLAVLLVDNADSSRVTEYKKKKTALIQQIILEDEQVQVKLENSLLQAKNELRKIQEGKQSKKAYYGTDRKSVV